MDIHNYEYKSKYHKYKSKYESLIHISRANLNKYSDVKNCKINKKYNKCLGPIYLGGALPKRMKKLQKLKKITICTYNIWSGQKFSSFSKLEKRLPYIVDEIVKDNPDIICLQEMSQQAIDYFKSRKEIFSEYFFFELEPDLREKGENKSLDIPFVLSKYKPRSVYKYMLETNHVNWPFLVLEFPNLIVVNVQLQGGNKDSQGITEKTDISSFSKCRIQQLKDIKNVLDSYKYDTNNVVFVGDLNFDPDTDPEKEELSKLGLKDAWRVSKFDEKGFTEDTTTNKMRWNIKHKRTRGRFDVILFRGNKIKPTKIKMIGTQPVFTIDRNDYEFNKHITDNNLDFRFVKLTGDRIQYWPSDRFGLIAEFTM